jgi:hypothetical protein
VRRLAIDRPLEFRSGLLWLNGEQRLPGMAEMLGREGIEWLRPLPVGKIRVKSADSGPIPDSIEDNYYTDVVLCPVWQQWLRT